MKRLLSLFALICGIATTSFAATFEVDPFFVGVVHGKYCKNFDFSEYSSSTTLTSVEGLPEGLQIYAEDDDGETEFYINGTTTAAAGTYTVTLKNGTQTIGSFPLKVVEMENRSLTCTGSSTTLPFGICQGDDYIKVNGVYANATVKLVLKNNVVESLTYSTSHSSTYGQWTVSDVWSESNITWHVVTNGKQEGISISAYHDYPEYYANVCLWNDGTATVYVGYYEYGQYGEIYIWEEDDEPGAPIGMTIQSLTIPKDVITDETLRAWLEELLADASGEVALAEGTTEEALHIARLLGVKPTVTKENDTLVLEVKTTFNITSLEIEGAKVTLEATITVNQGVLPDEPTLASTPKVKVKDSLRATWTELTPTPTIERIDDSHATIRIEVDGSAYKFYQVIVE